MAEERTEARWRLSTREDAVALTARGVQECEEADRRAGAGPSAPDDVPRGQEAREGARRALARRRFDSTASSLGIPDEASHALRRAADQLGQAVDGLQDEAVRVGKAAQGPMNRIITALITRGPASGYGQPLTGGDWEALEQSGMGPGVVAYAREAVSRLDAALNRHEDGSWAEAGGEAAWRRLQREALALTNATWAHAQARARREAGIGADLVREVAPEAASKTLVAGRAPDGAAALAFGGQYPYDPSRKDWADCLRHTDDWIDANACVLALCPDQGGAVDRTGVSGALLARQAHSKGVDTHFRAIAASLAAERLAVATLDAEGNVALREVGQRTKMGALAALEAGGEGWPAGSTPFGEARETRSEPPEVHAGHARARQPLMVVVDPAILQERETEDGERTVLRAVSPDGGVERDPRAVVIAAAARLGGARDLVVCAKAQSQGDHWKRSRRYRNNEPQEGIDPPAIGPGLRQALIGVAAMGRGAGTTVTVRRGWPAGPHQDLVEPLPGGAANTHFKVSLEELLDAHEEAQAEPFIERSRLDRGPPRRQARRQATEQVEPGVPREDALRIVWLVAARGRPDAPGSTEAALRTLKGMMEQTWTEGLGAEARERVKRYRADLIVNGLDADERRTLAQALQRPEREGGFGGAWSRERGQANAPTVRLVVAREPASTENADMVLTGWIDPVAPEDAELRSALAEAVEAGLPIIQWGEGLGLAASTTRLYGTPTERRAEMGLEGAACRQGDVDGAAVRIALVGRMEDGLAAGTPARCFALECREAPAAAPVPRTSQPAACQAAGRRLGQLVADALEGRGAAAPTLLTRRGLMGEVASRLEVDRSDLRLAPSKGGAPTPAQAREHEGPGPAL